MKRKARQDLRNLRSRPKYMVRAIRALENVQELTSVEDSGPEMAKLLARRDYGEAICQWVGSR